MGLQKDYEENQWQNELNLDDERDEVENPEDADHKKQVRRMLEEHLEKKRLKEELEDEFEADFDWDDFDKE